MRKQLSILLLFISTSAGAQTMLTLQDAIGLTLKNNFDIGMADVTNRQARRNNTIGNAGFLPNVAFNGSLNESLLNVKSELTNGSSQNNPNAHNYSYSPNISVAWTVFDGGRMFLVKKQLNQQEALTATQLRAQVQTYVSRTIQMYASLIWQNKRLMAIDTGLALAKVRMDIAFAKYQTGAGAKIDYLQAQVDFNARRADSINYLSSITQANDSLNVLMGINEDSRYMVEDSLPVNTGLVPIDQARLSAENLTVNAYRQNAAISHLNADIARTAFLPTISINGTIGYTKSVNSTGFALFTRNYGPSGTLGLTVPIFYGGNVRRQADVASLQAMKDELLYEKLNTVVGRQYRTAWVNYQVAVAAYNLERETVQIARENMEVQQARFRLGVGTTLESREAENDYVAALQRLYTATYNLKVNETIVLELQNQLVITRE